MRPTARALWLLGAAFLIGLAPVMASGSWPLWLACVLAVLLAGLADGLLALAPRKLAIEAIAPKVLYIGTPAPLRVQLTPLGPHLGPRVEVLCDLSPRLEPQPASATQLARGVPTEIELWLRARERGEASIDQAWARWSGPLGLIERSRRTRIDQTVGVLPNLPAVRDDAIELLQKRDLLGGLRRERYVGDGSEFDSMREYVPGMDPRAIQWKASGRHRKLIAHELRAERNQQLVLAFDTGHLMSEPLDGIPRLDHAIRAALLLAYASLRTGDRVGLFGFDERARLFEPPTSGTAAFGRLQHATTRLEYTAVETNFTLGLSELAQRLNRRTLIVLMTEFVDSITAELMLENVSRLARRHVVLFVTLRDASVEKLGEGPFADPDDVYRGVVAAQFVREREVVLERLRRLGTRVVSAPSGRVSAALLSQYLQIKQRGVL